MIFKFKWKTWIKIFIWRIISKNYPNKRGIVYNFTNSSRDDRKSIGNIYHFIYKIQALLIEGSNQLDPRFTLIRFESKSNQPMIRKWVNHDWPTFDFWFNLILIRRWIMIRRWIVSGDESKTNRIKMKYCDSKWIKMNQNQE